MAITLDENFKGSSMTLSSDKLTVSQPDGYQHFIRVTEGKTGGKWYWEYKWLKGVRVMAGFVSSDIPVNYTNTVGYFSEVPVWGLPKGVGTAGGIGNWFWENGPNACLKWTEDIVYRTSKIEGFGACNYGTTLEYGDILGIALDLETYQITYYFNGVSQGEALANLPAKTYYAAISIESKSMGGDASATFNLGGTPFQYPIPEGFLPYDYGDNPPVEPPIEKETTLLSITMLDSSERHYNLANQEILGFVKWFNEHTAQHSVSYKLPKRVGLIVSDEYVVFGKIISFNVLKI